ncbi:MAG: uroporphyrinogen-III C-methyltransferase [Firmicutes bacterium]|nr:uroporphyrinogen-III C-methyltransferase [Bacillota bacterium]
MGRVYLIGAGPGSKDLITVRGLELLREADAVLYDSLLDYALLEEVKPGCELIEAGKRMGSHSMAQDEINRILIDAAEKYICVVRLKGGDPFVFGRGGEEAMALMEAGIDFEVIPGVTSAVSVPMRAGIPVTHRGMSRSFHVITGHTKDDELDYGRYAMLDGTLIFLMGLNRIRKITSDLIAGGMDINTPAAVISDGFTEDEIIVRASLVNIAEETENAEVRAPAIIVVGGTAGMDLRPHTSAKECLIVGTRSFALRMKSALAKEGINSRVALELRPVMTDEGKQQLTESLANVEKYSWITFSSQNAVTMFFEVANEAGFDRRRLANVHFAVIGEATARILRQHGYEPDLMPEEYTGAAMARCLIDALDEITGPLLVIRAETGSTDMFTILDDASIPYEVLELYRLEASHTGCQCSVGNNDLIILASASGVRAFFDTCRPVINNGGMPGFACIGQYTAEQLAEYGAEPLVMAGVHTTVGLAEAIKGYFDRIGER